MTDDRLLVAGLEPGFASAVVLDNGVVPEAAGPEAGVATTPIRVELSGGPRVDIEATAPAALVVAVLRTLR